MINERTIGSQPDSLSRSFPLFRFVFTFFVVSRMVRSLADFPCEKRCDRDWKSTKAERTSTRALRFQNIYRNSRLRANLALSSRTASKFYRSRLLVRNDSYGSSLSRTRDKFRDQIFHPRRYLTSECFSNAALFVLSADEILSASDSDRHE